MKPVEAFNFGDVDFDNIEVKHELAQELEKRLTRAEAATDPALRAFQPSCDQYQLAVVRDTSNTIRIIAPAGAGKTQTLVNRLFQRVKEGVRPERLLMLTFDNAAASAIRTKLAETISATNIPAQQFVATTLNAFGYGLLRKHFPESYKPVIDHAQALSHVRYLKESLRKESPERHALLPSNLKNRFYLELFGFFKNRLFDPRELNAQALADYILEAKQASVFFVPGQSAETLKRIVQALIWLYRGYETALQKSGKLDFDDQKLRAWAGIRASRNMSEVISGQYDEVIVDEFQDINLLDFELIRLIAAKARLIVTGDDDQSIYGFRGCTPDYIIDFDKYIGKPAVSHELSVNYRCPKNIVEHATKLIRHNKRRVEKNPIAHRNDVASIKVVSAGSAYVEARSIVSFVKKIKGASKALGFNDFAVLYRTNAQSLPLQVEFILNDIPYYVREEDNLISNNALGRLLSILRVKVAVASDVPPKPRDAAECVRAYFQYLQPHTVEVLEQIFASNRPFMDVIRSGKFKQVDEKIAHSNLEQHIAEAMRIPKLVETLTYIGHNFRGMQGMIGSLEDVADGGVPLGEVFELAAAFKGSIEEFIKRMSEALERAKSMGAGRDREGGVALLTYFKAKGLQWHTVILMSCNGGLIPHRNAPLEDERRLFYVAMTRASSNLFVSYLKKACGIKVTVSPFLYESGLIAD